MPLPTPRDDEEQSEFISRCISYEEDQDTDMSHEQIQAACYRQWREHKAIDIEAMLADVKSEEENPLAAHIKAMDDDTITVAGYGVVWGGRDLEGEYFTKETDFWFDRITEEPMVLYHHGHDEDVQKQVVGRTSHKATDDQGLWIEAQIDRHNEYAEAIAELVEDGKLGYSSGAVGHLTEREKDGQIRSWPIAEFSLTPTPAEPRTLGVRALRSLSSSEPRIKALIDGESAEAESREERDLRVERAKARIKAIDCEMEL